MNTSRKIFYNVKYGRKVRKNTKMVVCPCQNENPSMSSVAATDNKALKGTGGIIGLTLALARCFYSLPVTAKYSMKFQEVSQ
jgi:hypothetical protein